MRFTLAPMVLTLSVLAGPSGAAWAADSGKDEAPAGWNLSTLQALQPGDGPLSLERAWRLATENAPQYQAAVSARFASQTARSQGLSNLLPQVQAGYYKGRIKGTQRVLDGPSANAESALEYDSNNAYVQLRQPVFDYGAYASYRQGEAQAAVGEAQFMVTELELAMELVEAYNELARAQEVLELKQALADSLEKQAKALRALFDRNEATRIDAQEVESRLALARAEVLTAERDLAVAHRALTALVGEAEDVTQVMVPANAFTAIPQPFPVLEQWLERARAIAPHIVLARRREDAAGANVRRASSRHYPKVELVAVWNKADSENLSTLSQRYNTFNIGLNLSIPIFSGGYDTAAHAQARDLLRRSTQIKLATEDSIVAEVIRQYTATTGGLDRAVALQTAVNAAEAALTAMRRSYELGLASNVDVLRTQDRLYQAREQLLEARLAVVKGYSSLRLLSGDPAWEVARQAGELMTNRS